MRCVGALGGDGQAVELARQADGEIADVDHLLHFAEALGGDLAGLEGDQAAELGLARAAPRRAGAPARRAAAPAPCASRGRPRGRGRSRPCRLLGAGLGDGRRSVSPVIGERAGRPAAAKARGRHAEPGEDGAGLLGDAAGADDGLQQAWDVMDSSYESVGAKPLGAIARFIKPPLPPLIPRSRDRLGQASAK